VHLEASDSSFSCRIGDARLQGIFELVGASCLPRRGVT
jgi:hypothetical protein